MTWGEIEQQTSHVGNISIDNPKFDPYVRVRLEQIGLGDIDDLYHFSAATKSARVWGVRIHEYFYFLWWDPHHLVYRSRR